MQWQEFRTHVRHLPAKDLARVEHAFVLGKKMHGDQKRRSGEPYFMHPVAVAHMLSEMGADADTIIAALLHDTVEDTPLTLDEIDAQFGGSVASLIDGVTKLSSKDVAMSPKLDEQIETLRKIFTLMQKDIRIMVIKLVDRLHNMQTVEFLPPERQKLLARETLEVFVKIADRLCMQDIRDELESLCVQVLDPEAYAKLSALRIANEHSGNTVVDGMHEKLRIYDRLLFAKTTLHFESKTWDQLRAQSAAGTSVITGLSTVTAVFTCPDIDSCYRIMGSLHQLWKREVLSFQDFINGPQINGYRGLHTTIIAHDGTRVRCKIRTKEMQEYARKGVTTLCFKSDTNIADILPWTKNLRPLAADTEGNSNDFFQSLKSDILGESIIIHGPDDSTVRLPREATALDGSFYLQQENALRTVSIRVNGLTVPFSATLQNAAAIDIALGASITCTREWLRHVQTGFAAAKIRIALAKQSEQQKLSTGKEMLQAIFTERKQGFLEEFKEDKLQAKLQALGYKNMNDVYASIGDGRLEPGDVFTALFEESSKNGPPKTVPATIVRYTVNMDSAETMDRLNLVHRAYGSHLEDIRYHRIENGQGVVTLRTRMLQSAGSRFRLALSAAGATNTSEKQLPNARHFFVIVILVLLWGLDPIFAKMLMGADVTPATFTVIRAWTVLAFAAGVLFLHGRRSLSRISMRHPSLWVAGISLFLVNALSYIFLKDGSPLLYNTVLRGNAVILAFPLLLKARPPLPVLASVMLGLAGMAVIIAGPFSINSIFLAIAIVSLFSVYTYSAARFQFVARIQARYAQLFVYTSLISAIASLSLLTIEPLRLPATVWPVVLTVLFCLVFIAIPYIIFHAITESFGYATLSPWINATVPVTLIAQVAIMHDYTGLAWLIPASVLLTSASLLASRAKRMAE